MSDMEKVKKRENPRYQAQDILSRRDHSEFEVRQKLRRKGFTVEQVDDTIAWLTEHRLLNDERFAALFVDNTLRFKAVGPRWLVLKLQQKGIHPDLIEPAVYGVIDDKREHELAEQAAVSWRRRRGDSAASRDKLIRFLVSRGFSYEVAMDVVSGMVSES